MRLVTLAAGVMAAAAVAGSARPSPATVTVSVSHRAVAAEPAEVPEERALGFRQWTTDFRVAVDSAGEPPCEPLRVSAVWRTFLNRRPIDREQYPGDILDAAGGVSIPSAAYAGETIELAAWAVCLEGNALRPVSSRVRDVVRVPLATCDQGPWRVLSVRGRAELQDDESRQPRFLRLRAGDALPGTDYVRTGPDGRLAFGDPRCGGLRVTLFERSSGTVGRYSRRGRGEVVSIWGRARATLDRHARGLITDTTPSLLLQPLGDRPATFEIRATARPPASIRLLGGHVLVRTQSHPRLAFLRVGDRVRVLCTPNGDCRVERSSGRRPPA